MMISSEFGLVLFSFHGNTAIDECIVFLVLLVCKFE